jgi:hypothetical protein
MGRLLLGVATILLAQACARDSAKPISYWVIDERTLGVQLIGGLNASCSIARTEEATKDIRVVAVCREPFFTIGSTAEGYPYDFVVSLEAPLADRRVLDGLGNSAERCETPRCGRPTG